MGEFNEFNAEVESYDLARRQIHAPIFGVAVGSGDAAPEEVEAVALALEDAAKAEGLVGDRVQTSVGDVGRSAGAAEIVAFVTVSIAAIATGVKQLDDAIPIIRKWARARASGLSEAGPLPVHSGSAQGAVY